MELWQIVVLAVVQGVTEFLPISSDGHLVVVATLLASSGKVANFEITDLVIVLHGGTLLSIVVFYWRRIWGLVTEDRRTILLIVLATMPTVLVGLPVKMFAVKWLGSPLLTGICLILNGMILWSAKWIPVGNREYRNMGFGESIVVGLAQAAAILPGLSRSCCTITTGLRFGFAPRSSATFSFLMAIPAIGGACVLEVFDLVQSGGLAMPIGHLVVGVSVSFVVGLAALWSLVRLLERGRFAVFAWWCIPLGAGVLSWQLAMLGR